MKNWKKRFVALITCIVFSIVSLPIVSAAEKLDNASDKEILSLAELPTVLSTEDTQREIEMIDTLAQKYYDYICQYGELPQDCVTFSSQRVPISSSSYKITEQSDINYDTYVAAAIDASLVNQFGYSYSASQVAQHLAAIGTAISAGGALPYVGLICAVTGAAILTIGFAVAVANHVGEFQDTTVQYYQKSKSYVATSATTTKEVARLYQQGYTYWACKRVNNRVNGVNVGGIQLLVTITKKDAQSIILKNLKEGEDVYCLIKNDALSLVMSLVGKGFAGFVGPETNDDYQIYNLSHYHMTYDKELKKHANTHVFFTYT